MNQTQISELLLAKHQAFLAEIETFSEEKFTDAPEGKWSPAQQLDHLCRSTAPLVKGLRLPIWLLKIVFGKANRPSRSYTELIEKYQGKLQQGGKASGQFVPKFVDLSEKAVLMRSLNRNAEALARAARRASDADLDTLVIPHPLLGKLTYREMLYFTVYHVEHHHKAVASL